MNFGEMCSDHRTCPSLVVRQCLLLSLLLLNMEEAPSLLKRHSQEKKIHRRDFKLGLEWQEQQKLQIEDTIHSKALG